MKRFDKIKDKMQEKAKDISISIEQEFKDKNEKNKENFVKKHEQFTKGTSNPEKIAETMYSYFIAFWIGTFISFFAVIVLLSSGNEKGLPLAILIIIGWPFWAIFCLIMMVPEVKIFGITIFSRKNLSFRQSVSFGKRIIYGFSREFYRSNPTMFFVLLTYSIFLIIAIAMLIT